MVMNSNRSYRSLVTVVSGHPIQLDSPLTIPFAVARASRGRRRRTRERVRGMSESPVGDERIGWGGCGQTVPGGRGVVLFTQLHTYESESAGEGVAVTGVR